jgi:hypothetical protein
MKYSAKGIIQALRGGIDMIMTGFAKLLDNIETNPMLY